MAEQRNDYGVPYEDGDQYAFEFDTDEEQTRSRYGWIIPALAVLIAGVVLFTI